MTPAFRDWIEEAKAVRLVTILAARKIALVGKGRNRFGPCPNCGGDDRFGVDVTRDLFNCRGCGGKGQGSITFVRWVDSCDFLQAVETITGRPKPNDEPKPREHRPARKSRGQFERSYDYPDEQGHVGYQVVRYAEPKGFSQRRPDPVHENAWIENLQGVRLVPYRLLQVLEAIANGQPVYWVEGEKDADTGHDLGLVATTTAMGLAGKGHWERGDYDEFFRDAHVVLVPDQDPDEQKGRELARVIGRRLKPIAASVRVLTLPVKDLTKFIEDGGTREMLDGMPLEDFVDTGSNGHAANGNGHAANGNGHDFEGLSGFTEFWTPPGEKETPQPPVEPTTYILPDPATIPPRRWLFGMHYMRKVVTATVAPGGFGKTTLALFEAISMVGLGHRVWYISGEDDKDEIDRRIAAHCKERRDDKGNLTRGEITEADLDGRLFVDDKLSFPFKIAKASRNGPEFDDGKLVAFEAAIIERKIDVIIIDPFVSFHFLSENDTAAMDALIKRLGEICVRCDCGLEISHHVRKPGIGQFEITVYDARGAAAIVNAVRSCRVINQMTLIEAQLAKVPDKPSTYIRIDSGKRNMAPPEKAHWLHLINVKIANGDHVQAAEHFEFKVDQVTPSDDSWLVLTMTSGQMYRVDSRSPEWLGVAVAKHFGRDPKEPGDIKWINRQIAIWLEPAIHRKRPLLRKVERIDKDRKQRLFFELVEVPGKPRESGDNIVQFPGGDNDDDEA